MKSEREKKIEKGRETGRMKREEENEETKKERG